MGDSFYFVRQGQLEVTKKTRLGKDAKISVISSGRGFGEMALLTCSLRSCSVRAITDVALFALPRTDFEEVVLNEAAFKDTLLREVEDFSQYNRIKDPPAIPAARARKDVCGHGKNDGKDIRAG